MVANKTDVVPYESLPAHTRAAIEEVSFSHFNTIVIAQLNSRSAPPRSRSHIISPVIVSFEGRS